jgi:NADPH:quinone reductase-like Zn-dependent oxidoreductase
MEEVHLPDSPRPQTMMAVRIHQFGGIETMRYEEAPRPEPGEGQVLVRVHAAGVGPWDALIRSGGSKLGQPLPITLGSDFAGVVESTGPGVAAFKAGDAVFGATNPQFTGAYADYAVADAGMIARKPQDVSDVEAASMPVVACTAWQMVFDHGKCDSTKRVLVLGGAGSVGAYAVQLAKNAGADVFATAFAKDVDYLISLGVVGILDVTTSPFERGVTDIDIVIDTVGGDAQDRAFFVLRPGGVLVSVVSPPDQEKAAQHGVHGVFFYVAVTSACLTNIIELVQQGRLVPAIGEVLPLAEVHTAHEMLAGKPHRRGKIVLTVSD